MKFTAQQIADILEGEVVGNPDEEVSKLSKIEEGKKDLLPFYLTLNIHPFIYTTNASIAIVNKSFDPEKEITTTYKSRRCL